MSNVPSGQMTQIERDYIYNTVKEINAKVCIESGTWYGGGSTLSLTKGSYDNNGMVYTYEECYDFYKVAKDFYDKSIYVNNIKLYNSTFIKGLEEFPDDFFETIDLVLLDGGDESPNGNHKLSISDYIEDYNVSENVQSFKFLENRIKVGCHLLLHDWTINTGRGSFIKRYLNETKNDNFEVIRVINESTGLAHLKKIK